MYPVTYEAHYVRERNRLTTFFRPILAIPWAIVAIIYGIAVFVVVIIAWFALLILGRYPDWAYNFNSGALRYYVRFNAWAFLQTDAWPPFGFGPDPSYPLRLQVAPRGESQSRLKTLFRIILAIPLVFVTIGINYLRLGAVVVAWLTIVFRGYQPAGVHNALVFIYGWSARAWAYILLLRDEYPPVGDERSQVVDAPAAGGPAPATPGTSAPPPAGT
jgi:hypothetical protein